MIRLAQTWVYKTSGLPRTRGDDPVPDVQLNTDVTFAPHARG